MSSVHHYVTEFFFSWNEFYVGWQVVDYEWYFDKQNLDTRRRKWQIENYTHIICDGVIEQ